MQFRKYLFPLKLITNLFTDNGCVNWGLMTAILVVSVCQLASLLITTFFEGTLELPGVGKGLLEHYGVWAIVLTDPLLVITTAYAFRLFCESLHSMPITHSCERREIEKIYSRKINFITMKDRRALFIYALFVIIGIIAWVNNLVQTSDPVQHYGNDVFDASYYTFGFIANKTNLFLSWVVVYPIVAFCSLSMSIGIFIILSEMRAKNFLIGETHHPDRCFGYSKLGTLNIVLLLPYFLTYEVMFFLGITHESNYLSLIVPLVGVTMVLLVVSYLTLSPLSSFITDEKNRQEKLINKSLQEARLDNGRLSGRLVMDSFYIALMHDSPYTNNARKMVIALRTITISMTFYKAIFSKAVL